jgi:hypothetical protein
VGRRQRAPRRRDGVADRELATSASFSQGSVSLPTGLTTTGVLGVNGATLDGATVTAGSGVVNVPTIRRTRVTAVNGIQFFPSFNATSTVDDVLVQVIPGASPGLGLVASANAVVGPATSTLTARHVTLVGSGVAGSIGVGASAVGGIFLGATSATTLSLSDAIVRGFATDLSRTAVTGPGSPATANLSVDFSVYDPTRVTSMNISGATGAITAGSHLRRPLRCSPSSRSSRRASRSEAARPRCRPRPVAGRRSARRSASPSRAPRASR